jgi:predicted phage-related endonuclease
MTVFLDKLGLSEPIAENEPMYWGKALEPVIAARYAQNNDTELVPGQFILRNEILGGTPDYLSPTKLIEIKTAGLYAARNFGEAGTDSIPDNYMCQVQWYLNLVDLEKADLVVLIGGQDYRIYHVNRNQKLIDLLVGRANRFWNECIVPQTPPPMDATDGSKQFLAAFFPKSTGNIVRANSDISVAARDLHELRRKITQLEETKALLENQIKYAIGDNDGVEDSNFKCTWKSTKDAMKTDWEACCKLNCSKDMIAEYTIEKPGSRRFIFNYTEK